MYIKKIMNIDIFIKLCRKNEQIFHEISNSYYPIMYYEYPSALVVRSFSKCLMRDFIMPTLAPTS